MNSSDSSPKEDPATDRAPKPSRKRVWLRRTAWSLVWVFTLVILASAVENWLGARALKVAVHQVLASGASMDPASVIPPSIPDEENFFSSPFFKPLFDTEQVTDAGSIFGRKTVWRDPAGKERLANLRVLVDGKGAKVVPNGSWRVGRFYDLREWQQRWRKAVQSEGSAEVGEPAAELLQALAKLEPDLGALRIAAQRPHARAPLRYEDAFLMPIDHAGVLRKLGDALHWRVIAQLSIGDAAAAHRDLLLELRLAESVDSEPALISRLVQIATLDRCMEGLWEGLARHQWNDAQLASLDAALGRFDQLAGIQRAFHGERVLYAGAAMDILKERPELVNPLFTINQASGDPQSPLQGPWLGAALWIAKTCGPWSGIIDFNRAHMVGINLQTLATVDPALHRVYPERLAALNAELQVKAGPYNANWILVRMVVPALGSVLERAASAQATLDMARCALAIERYRLRHGHLPQTLGELVPEFLPKVPGDVVSGDPLRYKAASDGTFLLYSVGGNGTDEGGEYREKPGATGRPLWTEGDWVWPQPSLQTPAP